MFLESGTYCIVADQGISITGGITEGDEVTLYMKAGDSTINATGDYATTHVRLTAQNVDDDLGGWLILVGPDNPSNKSA